MAACSVENRSWHVCAEKIQFTYSEDLSPPDQCWLIGNANMQSGAQNLKSFYFIHLLSYCFVLNEFLNHSLSVLVNSIHIYQDSGFNQAI